MAPAIFLTRVWHVLINHMRNGIWNLSKKRLARSNNLSEGGALTLPTRSLGRPEKVHHFQISFKILLLTFKINGEAPPQMIN